VLKGLIYLLIAEQGSVIRHLQQEYNNRGKQLFEGENAFYALRRILLAMLDDLNLARVYLMVDALDECDSELPQLLELIADHNFRPSSRVKWVVTSRNRLDVEELLGNDGSH